jgi:hypothetical protein
VRIGLNGQFRGLALRLWPQTAAAGTVDYPQGATAVREHPSGAWLRGLANAGVVNLAAEEERWLPWCVVAFGSGVAL